MIRKKTVRRLRPVSCGMMSTRTPRVVSRIGRRHVEREWRILLAHEPREGEDPGRVPDVEDLEVRETLRQLAREQDDEPRHEADDLGDEPEHPEHDEVRDREQPVHQRPPVRDLLGRIDRQCRGIWSAHSHQ